MNRLVYVTLVFILVCMSGAFRLLAQDDIYHDPDGTMKSIKLTVEEFDVYAGVDVPKMPKVRLPAHVDLLDRRFDSDERKLFFIKEGTYSQVISVSVDTLPHRLAVEMQPYEQTHFTAAKELHFRKIFFPSYKQNIGTRGYSRLKWKDLLHSRSFPEKQAFTQVITGLSEEGLPLTRIGVEARFQLTAKITDAWVSEDSKSGSVFGIIHFYWEITDTDLGKVVFSYENYGGADALTGNDFFDLACYDAARNLVRDPGLIGFMEKVDSHEIALDEETEIDFVVIPEGVDLGNWIKDATVAVSSGNVEESGVLISPEGLVLTRFSSLKDTANINVITASADTLPARISKFESNLDVALLKVSARKLKALPIVVYEEVEEGDSVLVVLDRKKMQEIEGNVIAGFASEDPEADIILESALNEEYYGAPVVNSYGFVVGLATKEEKATRVQSIRKIEKILNIKIR